jgi:hypothetical protein
MARVLQNQGIGFGLMLGLMALGGAGEPLAAGQTVADSGDRRVSLIELFTSEGCSSCPPAEKWMSGLREAEGLWREFVPVSFHVDYWDQLGWRDGYASREFTARQRAYGAAWGASSIYTPEFVLDGREWRTGRAVRVLPVAGKSAPGRLAVERLAVGRYRVVFHPVGNYSGGQAALALLGFDRVSAVARGENAGRKLAHDFVVLALREVPLAVGEIAGTWTATVEIAEKAGEGRLAAAAWVTAGGGSQAPLQAAGGWLPK